jgi:hypothetical protein
MKWASYIFFFGYAGTCVIAGVAGAVAAPLDIQIISGMHTQTLGVSSAVDLLSQYRFLRAIEAGFGLLVITQWRRIYAEQFANRVFLVAMAGGIGARLLGLVVDGVPSWFLRSFLISEIVGIVIIFLYTRRSVRPWTR